MKPALYGVEAITFDFFNTLAGHREGRGRGHALMAYLHDRGFECDPWDHGVLYDVFERHAVEYAPDASADAKHRYLIQLAERLFRRLNVRAPARLAADHAHALWSVLGPGSFFVYPEVPGTLRALRAAGYPLAVVSNWQCGLSHFCVELGIRDLFDHVLVSAELGCAKPDAKIFREACSLVGKEPGRVLHVGDTFAEDVAGAQAAGLHVVLLCRDGEPVDRHVHWIRSLAEVAELLGVRGPVAGTARPMQLHRATLPRHL